MSISPARLLAHNCCICLLLSLASFAAGAVTRIAPSSSAHPDTRIAPRSSAHPDTRDKNSHIENTKGKCQFNLTDSNQSLEVDSSVYQHQGFSQCEYIIQAASSRFILLNFTDIRSQSDMPVATGVLRPQIQQAATLTTPTTESILTEAHLVKSIQDNHKHGVNATSFRSDHIDPPLSTVVSHRSGDTVQSESVYNSRTDTGSIFPGPVSNDSHTRELSLHRTSPEDIELSLHRTSPKDIELEHLSKETDQSNTSFLSKNSNSPGVRDNSYSGLTTSSESVDKIDVHTEPAVFSDNCSFQLIIEEVNGTSGSDPQVICWRKLWQKRIPIVFQYSVPIRITYVWDRHSQSGFSLDFSFLRPEEANCLFRCNNHLCLPKKQLCDGYIDCPDHSDEHNTACALAREHEENGEPHIIKVVVIIVISVIVGVIIVLGLVFMISHSHCHDGAHRGGAPLLQPPHSQSSEVCRSPSDSMHDSGQYEALLHHPQRQTTTATFAVDSSHCMDQQQFLQQPHHRLDVEQQQQPQYHCHSNQAHCVSQHPHMSQEQLIRSLSFNAECALPSPGNPQVSRPLQHQQLQQQQLIYHQHSEHQRQQHRQCKKTHKHVSPSVLYPPNIPLSADGEEGYAMSQKALHSKQQQERNWQVQNEVFRPPPNKTVHDRDSPPPPYSLNPPGTKSLDSLVPPAGVVCVLRHARSSLMPEPSPSGVPRSHSLSCHQ